MLHVPVKQKIKSYCYLIFLLLITLLSLSACTGGKDRQDKYFSRAQQYYDAGNYDKSRLEVKNTLQINPQHPQARYLLAKINEQQQDWQGMYDNLKLVSESYPDFIPARLELATMYFSNNMLDKAKLEVDYILNKVPENPDANALLSSIYLSQGNVTKAVTQAKSVVNIQPWNIRSVSVLASVYAKNNPDYALSIIDTALMNKPDSSELKLLKINTLERSHRFNSITALYQQLIKQYPDNIFYSFQLVQFHKRQQQYGEAEKVIRALIKSKPEDSNIKLWLVHFMLKSQGPEQALAILDQFISAQPNLSVLQHAKARIQLTENKIQDAADTLKFIINQEGDPANTLVAKNILIDIALMQGQQEKAQGLLNDIFSIEPNNSQALVTRAKLRIESEDFNNAIADLRTVQKNMPNDVEILLLLAKAHQLNKSPELALDNYYQALNLEPDNTTVLFQAAKIEMSLNNTASGIKNLQRLLQIDTQQPEAQHLLVLGLIDNQQWDMASNAAQVLLKNKVSKSLGHYLLGRIYSEKNELILAHQQFEYSLTEDTNNDDALRALIQLYERQHNISDGISYLKSIQKLFPDRAIIHFQLGNLYRLDKQPQQALESYTKALSIDVNSAELYRELANFYASDLDNLPMAIYTLQTGIKQLPEHRDLHLQLAAYHELTGNFTAAKSSYQFLLEIYPDLQVAANNLAMLLVDHFSGDENYRLAEHLVQPLYLSKEPVFLDTAGWVNYKLGNYARAVMLLEYAAQLGGKNPQLSYHLGMAYLKENRTNEAKLQLQFALSDDKYNYPGRDEAKQILTSF